MVFNKKHIFIGIGILILVISLFLILKPSVSSKFANLFFDSKNKEIEKLERKNDSLFELNKLSEIKYQKLEAKQDSLNLINRNLKVKLKNLSIKYDEAINNYNRGNFDERYRQFSRLINGENPLPE